MALLRFHHRRERRNKRFIELKYLGANKLEAIYAEITPITDMLKTLLILNMVCIGIEHLSKRVKLTHIIMNAQCMENITTQMQTTKKIIGDPNSQHTA